MQSVFCPVMVSFNDEALVEDAVLTDLENAEVQDSLRTGISRHGEKNCSVERLGSCHGADGLHNGDCAS